MTQLFYKREDCRLCHSGMLDLVAALAPIPIATPNFRIPDASLDDPVFRQGVPLELYLCRNCGHLQILHVGNPEIQYRFYAYTTSVSLGLRQHFADLADALIARLRLPHNSFVVELGSNDGSLLESLKGRGMRVLGVDPAVEIAKRATARGIETIPEFFCDALGAQIKQERGPADLVIANNIFANVDNIDSLVAGIRDVLAPDGVFVFETQYGVDVTEKALLDTVYHEHLSYFNVKPLDTYFKRLKMQIVDVQNIWTKGGSIRVTVQLAGGPHQVSNSVAKLVADEERLGVDKPNYYRGFTQRIAGIAAELNAIADRCRADGRQVAGYGCSVGTTSLLPQFRLTDKIDFLVDDDPTKGMNLAGPGYDIPILPPEALYDRNPAATIIFAWRYVDAIKAKHSRYLDAGGKFVVPLPDVSICAA